MVAKYRIVLILLLALALRLIFVLGQDPNTPYTPQGGDTRWYLANASALVTGVQPGSILTDFGDISRLPVSALALGMKPDSIPTEVSNLNSPPLYFLVIGVPQALLSPAAAVIAIRVLQAILSVATCYFAYRLAILLTGREDAGLLVALVLAISPAFIVESGQILTETVYIFLIAGGVWLYTESVANGAENRAWRAMPLQISGGEGSRAQRATPLQVPREHWASRRGLALLLAAAVLLGLATLTRAVFLAFPFGLAIHLLLVYGRKGWKRAAAFLLVYWLVVLTWTAYSVARWNRFVIAGEGLPAFFYMGVTGWDSPEGVDQRLVQQSPSGDYLEAASSSIGADPVGWVRRRVGELASAYLQPHGTTFYPGESLRDLALKWARDDRSLAGLIALTQGDAFWQKLVLYALHYIALIAGAVGMWRYRRRWRAALPMLGFIAYVTLVHLALYALPRYLFPTEVFLWVFAAAALSDRFARNRSNATI
jgi:4-amino-4-deoxy-L-arabinose transferase-like glycosyltransferase